MVVLTYFFEHIEKTKKKQKQDHSRHLATGSRKPPPFTRSGEGSGGQEPSALHYIREESGQGAPPTYTGPRRGH